jgi:hypothetical protein
MEFKGSTHVVIPHNRMELLKGKKHIVEITRAMLNEKNLPNYFWAEAVTTAIYIINRTPTSTIYGMTPEEKLQARNQMSPTSKCLVALHTCMFLMRRNQN